MGGWRRWQGCKGRAANQHNVKVDFLQRAGLLAPAGAAGLQVRRAGFGGLAVQGSLVSGCYE